MLRHDTADSRLSPRGRAAGLLGEERWERFVKKTEGLEAIAELLRQRKVGASPEQNPGGALARHVGDSLERALTDSAVKLSDILPWAPELSDCPREWLERAALDIKYAGYIEKEQRMAARSAQMDAIRLAADLDYAAFTGLSAEAREKLRTVRPLTVGQAARIPGLRQGDIALLIVAARK
jgi:tRNA uridine 5-carboxymethylaminomethyl modification enzyme